MPHRNNWEDANLRERVTRLSRYTKYSDTLVEATTRRMRRRLELIRQRVAARQQEG